MGIPNEEKIEAYHIEAAKRGSERLLKLLKRHHGVKPAKLRKRALRIAAPEPIRASGLPRVHDIKRATTRYFNLTAYDLDSSDTSASISYSRHIAMYLAREVAKRSFPEIGRYIGGRDHGTVIHGTKKIRRLILSDWTVAYDVAHLEVAIGAQ